MSSNQPPPESVADILAGLNSITARKKEADAVVEAYTANLRQQLLDKLAAGGTTGDRFLDFLAQAHGGYLLPGLANWLHQLEAYTQARVGQPVVLVRTHWKQHRFGGPTDHSPFEQSHHPEVKVFIGVLAIGQLQLIADREIALPTQPRHIVLGGEEYGVKHQLIEEPLPALDVFTLIGWLKDQSTIVSQDTLSDEEKHLVAYTGGAHFSPTHHYEETTQLVVGTEAWIDWLPRPVDGLSHGYHPNASELTYYQYSQELGHALPKMPQMKRRLVKSRLNLHQYVIEARQRVDEAKQALDKAERHLAEQIVEEKDLAEYIAGFPPDEPMANEPVQE